MLTFLLGDHEVGDRKPLAEDSVQCPFECRDVVTPCSQEHQKQTTLSRPFS